MRESGMSAFVVLRGLLRRARVGRRPDGGGHPGDEAPIASAMPVQTSTTPPADTSPAMVCPVSP